MDLNQRRQSQRIYSPPPLTTRAPLASQQVRWVKPEELGNFPFPAANARIIEALLKSLG